MISTLSFRMSSLPMKASISSVFVSKAGIFTTPSMALKQEMPKRPLSPFILFSNDTRPQLKAERPDLSIRDLTKELAKMYASLSNSTLNEYKAKFEKNKEIYREQMAQVSPDLLEANMKEKREKRLKKIKTQISKVLESMGKPKTKTNGYALFIGEEMETAKQDSVGVFNITESFKAASVKWNALSDDQKADYNKLASDINAERAKELEAWNEKMKDTEEMVKLVELQKKKKSSMSKLNAKAEPDEN